MTFPAGVSARITAPVRYTMTYLNGTQSYTEPFALITCSRDFVVAAGASLEMALAEVAAATAKIPYAGPALAGIIELGVHWYTAASLNQDGSVTFQFAYHYCGTKAGGIDLTATPIPGVDPRLWFGLVNGLMRGLKALGPTALQGIGIEDSDEQVIVASGKSPEGRALFSGYLTDLAEYARTQGLSDDQLKGLEPNLDTVNATLKGLSCRCWEVDPTYNDPQGDCKRGDGTQGVWRCMVCEWYDENGVIVDRRRNCWCGVAV